MKRCVIKQLILWTIAGLSLLPLEAFSGPKPGEPQKDYLLVVNSYTSDMPWSMAIINPLRKYIASKPEVDIYLEHMNVLLIDDSVNLRDYSRFLFRQYHYPPKAIVLLGASALMLGEEFKAHWGEDVPVVLCTERDFFAPLETYMNKQPIPADEKLSFSSLRSDYNITVLQARCDINRTFQIMRRMLPEMNSLLVLGDTRYVNKQLDYDLRELLRASYPDMKYEYVAAEHVSTDSLMMRMEQMEMRKTGVLFASWFVRRIFRGHSVLMANGYQVIANSPLPVFALEGAALSGSMMVGGYFHKQDEYNAHLLDVVDKVLAGKQPKDIPYYVPEAFPIFDYPTLEQNGFTTEMCPSDSIFLNRPESFWSKHWAVVIGCVSSFILLLLYFYQSNRLKTLKAMREAQQKEIETTQELASLFANMPVTFSREQLIRDEQGKIIDARICQANNRYFEVTGRTDEVVGKKLSECMEKDYRTFVHFFRIMDKEKRPLSFTYYQEHNDTYVNIVLTFSNKPGCVDLFGMDSTELHKTQLQLDSINHKLAMALEVSNITPWKWDLKKHAILCDVNRAVRETGTECPDEQQLSVPDLQYFAKIHKEDRERVRKAYTDLLEGSCSKVKEEYRVFTRDPQGLWKIDWIEARATVDTRDEKGAPLTLVGSSMIITPRKIMEENLLNAKYKAEESNKLKSAFLANMSHEIRTPLNAIVGFSNLLPSVEDPEEQKEYIHIIESNNALLLQLITDILDLSKIEAGTLDFVYTDLELNTLLTALAATLQLKLADGKVTMTFEPGLPECFVHMEKNRLSQLIINLLSNAVKFTREGEIRFGYEIRGEMLYFYCKDTGVGIPADKINQVFDRFVKLNNFAQGTGLGLSICKSIVETMHGEMGVQSEEGKGSLFWFTLPYRPVNPPDLAENKEKQVKPKGKRLSILIAEDNESNYKLFHSILKEEYDLRHAWNGEEAVRMADEEIPDIILMDLNMPVMDGYEAARRIRQAHPLLPIMAVTAFAYASDEQRVMDNGFDGYMAKPIQAASLKEKLTGIIQSRIMLL